MSGMTCLGCRVFAFRLVYCGFLQAPRPRSATLAAPPTSCNGAPRVWGLGCSICGWFLADCSVFALRVSFDCVWGLESSPCGWIHVDATPPFRDPLRATRLLQRCSQTQNSLARGLPNPKPSGSEGSFGGVRCGLVRILAVSCRRAASAP